MVTGYYHSYRLLYSYYNSLMPGLRYLIYARKSQENRDRQVLSIESQVTELRDFAKRSGLNVVSELEESQTAYKPGRLVFGRMMEMLDSGLANGVLVWKPDRIARNAKDGGTFIQAMDDGKILELRTPYECLRRDDNRLMMYIYFGMSNDYSRQISANVKRGNREKYRRGEFLGRAPVGYLNAKIGNSHNIIPDPAKAQIIKRLFQEAATGKHAVLGLCKLADEWGLTSVNGKPFAKSGMYKLLSCTAYYGIFRHGGEDHEGSYEKLITKELFDAVQAVLRGRSKPRKQDWVHAYKALIKCGGCGCAITAETKTKHYHRTNRDASYTYYRCTRRRGGCREEGMTDPELEQAIGEYMAKIEIDEDVWKLGIELLEAKNADRLEENARMRRQLEREREEVEAQMEKLLRLRMDEEITADEYAMEKSKMLDRKVGVSEKLIDRDQNTANWLELAENFFETAYSVRRLMEFGNPMEKRELVKAVGWNLILIDKKLQFSFRKPFDVLLQPAIRNDVQGWKESDLRYWFWRPKACH